MFAGLLTATPAHAEPTVDQIEAQIDTQWEQLEPVIEQYNKVHSQLTANQKKAAALQKKIQPLSLGADLAMARMGAIASRYYMTGPGSDLNALLATGSTSTFVQQLTLLDRLAAREHAQVADVLTVRDKYATEQQKLDALIAQQRQQDAELAARKKQIDGEIDKLQQMRTSAYGSSSSGGALRIGPCPAEYVGGSAGKAVKTACAQIGKPYVWGAGGPGSFDCSGLTSYAWGKAGVGLSHHAAAQWHEGKVVSRANARPGDLVFFNGLSHVGIYVGNGLMVHAPRAGKPVQMGYITEMSLMGFRRPG